MEMRIQADIIKAADSIRKKYKLLKQGFVEEENLSKKKFAPLLRPIETLIDLSSEKKGNEEGRETLIKKEVESQLEDVFGARQKKKIRKGKDTAVQTREEGSVEVRTPPPSYRADIYETPDDAEKAWIDWEKDAQNYGPLTKKYLNDQTLDTRNKFDNKFGVRPNPLSKRWLMGNKVIEFDGQDFIHIDDQMYRGTAGLFELLFKKIPNTKVMTNFDREVYKKILEQTSAHYQLYNPNLQIASSSGVKYKNIIRPLFKKPKLIFEEEKEGSSLIRLTDNKIDYVYWEDPNELVERLLLLKSSERAGNNSHSVEIASIEEELREGGFIK